MLGFDGEDRILNQVVSTTVTLPAAPSHNYIHSIGGNYHTLYTARTYLEASGKLKHVGNEILQTLYTLDVVGDIINTVITTTSLDLTGS